MGLISGNNDLISQILEIFGNEMKKKEKDLVREIADEQKYSGNVKKNGSELTSGTVKLMAIFPRGKRSKTWGLLEEVPAGVLEVLKQYRHQESRVWAVE